MRYGKQFHFKMDDEQPKQDEGIFTGYGAVFGNIDDGGDIIEPGAFAETLKTFKRVKILALHSGEWLPIGVPLEMHEDEHGLHVTAKISDTSLGRDVRALMRDGVLKELSIGYGIPDGGMYVDDNGIRHLTRIDLHEISVVTWAMNDQALVTDYKSLAADAQAELKAGRKISGKRLEALKECRDGMKTTVKLLDGIIREAESEPEKARQPPPKLHLERRSNPAFSRTHKHKPNHKSGGKS